MDIMDFIRPLGVILFFLVAKSITNLKITALKFIIWLSIAYVLVAVSLIFGNITASLAVLAVTFALVYSSGIKAVISLMVSMSTMIIMIISNTLSNIILKAVCWNYDLDTLETNNICLFTSLIFLNFILSHIFSKIIFIILHKKLKIKSVDDLNNNIKIVLFITTFLVFIFIYFTRFINGYTSELLYIYLAFFIFLFIFTYFGFNATLKDRKIVRSKNELEHLEKYTANIESMYHDICSIRHDYANVISSMAGYIADEDMEGLKEYFEKDIIQFSNRMKLADNNLAVLSRIKQTSLKGTLAVKLIRAHENNITFLVDIRDDIHIKGMDILDLNRIVGILLDNAHEAALMCDKPFIDAAFIKNEKTITIIIINSVKEKDINIKKIYRRGFSTKGENRGYGLSNIISILEKYPNVLLDTVVEDNKFKQVIYIDSE